MAWPGEAFENTLTTRFDQDCCARSAETRGFKERLLVDVTNRRPSNPRADPPSCFRDPRSTQKTQPTEHRGSSPDLRVHKAASSVRDQRTCQRRSTKHGPRNNEKAHPQSRTGFVEICRQRRQRRGEKTLYARRPDSVNGRKDVQAGRSLDTGPSEEHSAGCEYKGD